MDSSVSLGCLNYTSEFSVGTAARDSVEWLEETSQQFSISGSNMFMLIQLFLEMRNYKEETF